MQELKQTVGTPIKVPIKAKRYAVAYFLEYSGWVNSMGFHTTPESALNDFLNSYIVKQAKEKDRPKFYTVYELELEIPVTE
jgi:hypothetical protein